MDNSWKCNLFLNQNINVTQFCSQKVNLKDSIQLVSEHILMKGSFSPSLIIIQ